MNILFRPVGFDTARKLLREADKKRVGGGHKALRETGKDAVKRLRADIRGGGVGGSNFGKLRNVSRFTLGKKFMSNIVGPKRNRPMAGFAKHVRLNPIREGSSLSLGIGFVKARGRGSQGMINLAGILQKAGRQNVSARRRGFFRAVGSELVRRNKKSMAKFFFLKDTTTSMHRPAREMIDPFWDANSDKILRDVKSLYLRYAR